MLNFDEWIIYTISYIFQLQAANFPCGVLCHVPFAWFPRRSDVRPKWYLLVLHWTHCIMDGFGNFSQHPPWNHMVHWTVYHCFVDLYIQMMVSFCDDSRLFRRTIYVDIYIYILLFPRNAYNMAKIRGTVRGTEGGTVRGWRSKKLVLDRSKTRTSGAWDSSLARSNACHNLEMIRG
jgi:hypothetical protein